MKTCNKCKKEKNLELFYKRIDSKDGYRDICKECQNKPCEINYKEQVQERKYLSLDGKRRCNHCKDIKILNEDNFFKRNIEEDGWSVICKPCGSIQKRNIRYKFYLTENGEAFNDSLASEMIKKQDCKCYICKRELNLGTNLYAIDHDHKTMKVRKILCGQCNQGLGKFLDNPELLRLAANYLEEHK